MTNATPVRERVPIKQLKRARYNPRKISKKELQKLVESIKTYGLVQPILVNKDHTIIGGHQRVEACRNILFFAKGKEVAINSALRELLLSGLTATAHHDVLIFKK